MKNADTMLAYKFRLYPNQEKERKLPWTLEVCRKTYNRFLEMYYGGEHDRFKLQALLPVRKESDADLKGVHSKVLQYELHLLFANLASLRELKKCGRRVGKLRFKPSQRFRTITYNQSGFWLEPKNEKFSFLHLSKIGDIPIRMHRAVDGMIKGVTIKHMPSGKWFAYLLVDDGRGPSVPMIVDNAVGIDVGLEHYAVDSDSNEVENPRHLKNVLKKLRREQRRLSRKQKGSRNFEKQRIIVARTYERVCDQRNDFQHKLARQYVDDYDLIITEKLDTREMIEDGHLARSICDAAWSSFDYKLAYKAERAGKLFVQVDPRGTGQECSNCGEIVPKTLSERWHDCPFCGLSMSRDHNASINILNRGVEKVGQELPELACGHWTATSPSMVVQARWMKQGAPPAWAG
jgi:putative transposase